MSTYLTAREAAERLGGPMPKLGMADAGGDWAGRALLQEAHAAGRIPLTGQPLLPDGRRGARGALPQHYFEDGALDLGDNSAGPDGQGDFERYERGQGVPRWTDVRAFVLDVATEVAALGGAAGSLIGGSVSTTPPWWPWPQEKLVNWVQRNEVITEAERRVSARHLGKASINGALWTMVCEAGGGLASSQKVIASTIRRLPT